jgi:hypothetical protein
LNSGVCRVRAQTLGTPSCEVTSSERRIVIGGQVAIAKLASGIQVARSPRDLTMRSPEVSALGFASREVPRTEVWVGMWKIIRWDPHGRRVDTRCLETGVSTPLNSRISGTHRIGG